MKVDPVESNTIVFTYWGMDNRAKMFDYLSTVYGVRIAKGEERDLTTC